MLFDREEIVEDDSRVVTFTLGDFASAEFLENHYPNANLGTELRIHFSTILDAARKGYGVYCYEKSKPCPSVDEDSGHPTT
jgi:hypothetical protein